MKLAFLQLPSTERRIYFEQAALRRGLSPVVVEKDFWVSWLLAVLFESRFADALVLKGGMSLWRVFNNCFMSQDLCPRFLNSYCTRRATKLFAN